MSQYYGYTRSSYFHVIDESALRAVLTEVVTSDDEEVYVWKKLDAEGKDIIAFGCNSDIRGICPTGYDPDGDNDPDYDCFIKKLQECLVEGDVLSITEVGHEKLSYLAANAVIVSKHNHKYIDLESDVVIPAMDEMEPNHPESIRMDY